MQPPNEVWNVGTASAIIGPSHPIVFARHRVWRNTNPTAQEPILEPCTIFAFVPSTDGNHESSYAEVFAVAADSESGRMFTAPVHEFELDPAWAKPQAFTLGGEK